QHVLGNGPSPHSGVRRGYVAWPSAAGGQRAGAPPRRAERLPCSRGIRGALGISRITCRRSAASDGAGRRKSGEPGAGADARPLCRGAGRERRSGSGAGSGSDGDGDVHFKLVCAQPGKGLAGARDWRRVMSLLRKWGPIAAGVIIVLAIGAYFFYAGTESTD